MGFELGPSPRTVVVNAVTLMSVERGQNDVETIKTWSLSPLLEGEPGMVADPHLLCLLYTSDAADE